MATDSPALGMLRDPLGEKLANGETALGMYVPDPTAVELAAHMGFDWIGIEQMFSSNGWAETEEMIRTAESAGITPIVRVQANPWLGYNPQVAVDVTRNLGIGAQYVVVSNSGEGEIDDCVTVARDWHRKVGHIHPFDSDEEWEDGIEDIEERTHVIPQPETLGGLEAVEELMKRPEIRIVFFAMTDASRELVGSEYSRSRPDWYLEELWEMVDRAVELGEEHGCAVAANTSYAYDVDELADRVVKLHEHGVRMIMLQSAPFLFQVAVGDLLEDVRGRIG